MIDVVNLRDKLEQIARHWSPHIVGDVGDMHVKLVKFQGEFLWHHHENEDEMFLVVKGQFTMKLRERDLQVREGEFVVIPRGVEHMPVAEREAHVLLFEPKSTLNTGNVQSDRTIAAPARI